MKLKTYLDAKRIQDEIKQREWEMEAITGIRNSVIVSNKAFIKEIRISIDRGNICVERNQGALEIPYMFFIEICDAAYCKREAEIEKLNKEFEDLKEGVGQ